MVSSQAHIFNASNKRILWTCRRKSQNCNPCPPCRSPWPSVTLEIQAGTWLLSSYGPTQPLTLRKLPEARSCSSLSLWLYSVDSPAQWHGSVKVLALLFISHCWLTLKEVKPQEKLPPGFLSTRNPRHSHHRDETCVLVFMVLQDGGSEKPSAAFRWIAVKCSCWAEHLPPDY